MFTLDAKRLLCPMPVIRTQDRIKELNAGDQLTVICKVIDTQQTDDEVTIIIEVGSES